MMLRSEIEKRLKSVIEKDTIGISLCYANIKRNRFIQWILVERIGIGIRVPISNTLSTQIQIRRLITQAKENLIGMRFFCTVHIITAEVYILFPVHWRKVCIQHLLLCTPEGDKKVILFNKTGDRVGLHFIMGF